MKFDYEKFEDELEVLLGIGVIDEWQAFGPGHYRINHELDIWPKNRKYFVLETGETGQYGELRAFVGTFF